MSDLYVKVTEKDNVYVVPIDGEFHGRCKCEERSNGSFRFVYQYESFISGGSNYDKELKETVIILKPGKLLTGHYKDPKWEYVKGCYNEVSSFDVELITLKDAYSFTKRLKEGLMRANILLELNKTKEFLELVEFANQYDNSLGWSIYGMGSYAILSIAYSKGLGKEVDERKALFNALRSCEKTLLIEYMNKGYFEGIIPNPEELRSQYSIINAYYAAMGLLKEGFVQAYKSMVKWKGDIIHYNNEAFYSEKMQNERHYQSLFYKELAKVSFEEGNIEDAIVRYGTHLSFEKYGHDKKIHYEAYESDDDPYDPSYSWVNKENKYEARRMVDEASKNGDEFAKALISKI